MINALKNCRTKRFITIVVAVVLVDIFLHFGLINNTKVDGFSVNQKVKDFSYLCEIVEKNYCFYDEWSQQSAITFNESKNQYISKIKESENDDGKFLSIVNEFMNQFNDLHTRIVSPQRYWSYMHEQEAKKKYLSEQGFNAYYNELNSVRNKYIYWSKAISHDYTNYDVSIHQSKGYTLEEYPEYSAIYLKIPQFLLTIEEKDQIEKYLLENEAKNFILDVRGNTGGYSYDWINHILPVVIDREAKVTINYLLERNQVKEYKATNPKKITQITSMVVDEEIQEKYPYYFESTTPIKPTDEKRRYENFYLLVDGDSKSATEHLTTWVKYSNTGIIIGSQSGGVNSASTRKYKLPNSGLFVRISNIRFLYPDGSIRGALEGTKPDIECDPEKALEVVLDIIKTN